MTVLLAGMHGNTVLLCGDTRATNGSGEYFDGFTKVFKVNRHVLAGVAGDIEMIDVLKQAVVKLKAHKTALQASRAFLGLLGEPKADADFVVLFVSKGQAVEMTPTGVLEVPLTANDVVRAGTGGLVAEVAWKEGSWVGPGLHHALDRLERAVAKASKYLVNCSSEVRTVLSGA